MPLAHGFGSPARLGFCSAVDGDSVRSMKRVYNGLGAGTPGPFVVYAQFYIIIPRKRKQQTWSVRFLVIDPPLSVVHYVSG